MRSKQNFAEILNTEKVDKNIQIVDMDEDDDIAMSDSSEQSEDPPQNVQIKIESSEKSADSYNCREEITRIHRSDNKIAPHHSTNELVQKLLKTQQPATSEGPSGKIDKKSSRKCMICDTYVKKGVTTFLFPRAPNLFRAWLEFAKLPTDFDSKKATSICAKHFKPEDFSKKTLHTPRLVPDAVPSIWNTSPPPKTAEPVKKVVAAHSNNAHNIRQFLKNVQKTTLQKVEFDTICNVKCYICFENFANDIDMTKKSPYSGRQLNEVLGESDDIRSLINLFY